MSKRFIQFELWKDCKQGCPFCCNRGQRPINKAESIKYVLDKLNELEPNTYDYIGLIGGEFFNGEIDDYLYSFFVIMNRINELNPEKVFITTSLLFDIKDSLVPVLQTLKRLFNMEKKIVLCTSWDKEWRFGNGQQALWSKNMLWLKNHFPDVELHTEMILTQPLIDSVISGEIDLNLFKQIFRCNIDFIEPSSGLWFKNKYDCDNQLPGFFTTKASFIEFLKVVKDEVDLDNLLSMELRSEELYYIDNGERKVAKNRRQGDGRCEISNKNVAYDIGFIDSDIPMRDVVIQFKEIING